MAWKLDGCNGMEGKMDILYYRNTTLICLSDAAKQIQIQHLSNLVRIGKQREREREGGCDKQNNQAERNRERNIVFVRCLCVVCLRVSKYLSM